MILRWTGRLTLNEVLLLSPLQLRDEWAKAALTADQAARETEHTDPPAHYKNRGVCVAHAQAVDALDRWIAEFRRGVEGLPLANIVECLHLMRRTAADGLPADAPEVQRTGLQSAVETLDDLAKQLSHLDLYRWLEI